MLCRIVEHWDEYLRLFPDDKKDIYFYENYVNLYSNEESLSYCVVCEDGQNVLLMPFIRKEIDGFFDFETAYGYGGPIANTEDASWIAEGLREIHRFLGDKGYVCGFMRYHPLIRNGQMCRDIAAAEQFDAESYKVIYDRNTIAIDTSVPEEEIWLHQITSKNRNMIRKAEKNDLIYKSEFDFSSLEEFEELYRGTMERLEAEDFYFFDNDYFREFASKMSRHAFLGTVRKDGKLICGALFMFCGKYGHYHLEGSNRDYSSLGANNFLLWNAALEMHNLGVEEFHLGGGTDSNPDNSLFKFKRCFSGNQREFFIGKEIFNHAKYSSLCDTWEKENPKKIEMYGNRLLKYRYVGDE